MKKKINCLFVGIKKFMGFDAEAVGKGKEKIYSDLVSQHPVFELTKQIDGESSGSGCLFQGEFPLDTKSADGAAQDLQLFVILFADGHIDHLLK